MPATENPINILLVEDSADDVFFFRRAMNKSGLAAALRVASDGIEAIDCLMNKGMFSDRAANPAPDIMFLDLKLPHVNGFEVLEWMRRHAECPHPPVIVLTSSNQPEDQQRAEALGAALYLIKPPAPDQLREVVSKFMLARSN